MSKAFSKRLKQILSYHFSFVKKGRYEECSGFGLVLVKPELLENC